MEQWVVISPCPLAGEGRERGVMTPGLPREQADSSSRLPLSPTLSRGGEGARNRGGRGSQKRLGSGNEAASASPYPRAAEGAVAGQEHGISLVETWLKLALVIEIEVFVVRAD